MLLKPNHGAMPTTVNCPTCNKSVAWTPESSWRPFCSERCRLIDLGEWFNEERRIPGEDAEPGSEERDA